MRPNTPLSTPYWWEAAPLTALAAQDLPAEVDVLIVGAGYTGLAAALELARAGRAVLALDRQHCGEGASTRNGGITSGNIRVSHAELIRKFGEARALGIQAEGKAARDDLRRFIETENIDCDYRLTGRFSGAMNRADYDAGARQADTLAKTLGIESYAVPQAEQHRYLGTDFYRGGNVRMDIGGLHPAKFHAGLLRTTLTAGAMVQDHTAVQSIRRDATALRVATTRGTVRAGQVLICTNGYGDGFDPWLRHRIVPVHSRIIATEPLPAATMDTLMPARMMCSDSRQLSYYYRPSPDGERILFGGRDGTIKDKPAKPTEHLRAELLRLFPDLEQIRLTHSWFGQVAMHRDMIPRLFSKDGVRYATGFCGSGVVWARWLGIKAARQILGDAQSGNTAFDFRPPKSIPFFNGRAWFMPAVYTMMAFADRRLMKGRDRN